MPGKCCTCDKKEITRVHQCFLPLPYSSGYCDSCSDKRLESLFTLRWIYFRKGGRLSALLPGYAAVVKESLAFHGKTEEDLRAMVEKDIAEDEELRKEFEANQKGPA